MLLTLIAKRCENGSGYCNSSTGQSYLVVQKRLVALAKLASFLYLPGYIHINTGVLSHGGGALTSDQDHAFKNRS